ncbi:hypothetical protein DRH29_04660 [candidate division Kazan bacterium]|uniref:Uncharacterized protein n=1 Tax=candidate division Kazan bacterium TaxID=2202143 RepID=A0A420ZBL4_UNCK3|nr:MAG: hypothetical protein DRH29_04660 [candidate division Kazan bacterium]
MGTTQIVWDGNTITLGHRAEAFTPVHKTLVTTITTQSGYNAYRSYWCKLVFKIKCGILTAAEERALTNFWFQWARHGYEFSIAWDSDQCQATTTDQDYSPSTPKRIYLANSTWFSLIHVGDEMVIYSSDRDKFEVFRVASISSPDYIEADTDLTYFYENGDTVRHYWYLPYARLVRPEKYIISTDGEGRTNARHLKMEVEESVQ